MENSARKGISFCLPDSPSYMVPLMRGVTNDTPVAAMFCHALNLKRLILMQLSHASCGSGQHRFTALQRLAAQG